jgi:hypothetical protein
MSAHPKYVPGPQGMPYAPSGSGTPWQPPGAPPMAPNGTQMMAATASPPWGAPAAPPGATPWQGHAPQARHHAPQAQHHAPQVQHHAPQVQHHAPQVQHHAPQVQHHAPLAHHQAQAPVAPSRDYAPPPQNASPAQQQAHAVQGYAPPPQQALGANGAWQQGPAQHQAPAAGHAGQARPQSPVAGCAHAYPLTVRKAGLIAATKLSFKTLPYALFRFGQASLFAGVGALQLCVIAGLAYALVTFVHPIAGGVVVLAGLLAWALLWLPFVEHKMFASWCGHVAILTELVTKGAVGNGSQGMFAFGRELAATRLGDIETVWEVYRTINRSLRRLGNLLNFADDLLPIDLGPVKRLVHRVVSWAAPYVEGVIVSYGLARGDRDFQAAGADGLCYGVQNAKSLFKTALGVLLLEQVALLPAWVASLALFVPGLFYVTYVAAGGDVSALLDGNAAAIQRDMLPFIAAAGVGGLVGGAFSLLAVKTVKEAFVKPTLLTMVMVKFHVAIENQPLDPSVRARVLDANSGLTKLDGARAMLRRAGV